MNPNLGLPHTMRSLEGQSRKQSISFLGTGPNKPVLQEGLQALPMPLRIGTQSMIFWIGFFLGTANLSEIVPAARELSEVTIETFVEEIPRRGGKISCRKGCHAACCRHLMVSLSVPEALAMVGEVDSLDAESRTRTIRSCATVAAKIRDHFKDKPSVTAGHQLKDGILDWYMDLDVECPFFVENCCSIYKRRPMTCRECLVTSPDSLCKKKAGQLVKQVNLPIRFSAVLTQLSRELYNTKDELVVLPCVFDWFIENSRRYQKSWPTEYLVRRFIEITVSHHQQRFSISFIKPDRKLLRSRLADDRDITTVR